VQYYIHISAELLSLSKKVPVTTFALSFAYFALSFAIFLVSVAAALATREHDMQWF